MEKKIGKDISSGAEKVEALEKKRAREDAGVSHDRVAEQIAAAQTAETAAAEARFEAAKARAAKKEAARMEKSSKKQESIEAKLKAKEKRMEALAKQKSEKAAQHAQKAARREMIATESAAEKEQRLAREKREKLAEKSRREEARAAERRRREEARKTAQSRRAAEKRKKKEAREEKRSGKKRAPGIGGWIAAVVSLGAACLALATVVTAGSFRMNEMAMRAENAYRATLYELVSVSEAMDDNLAKLRISAGVSEQRSLLTDILVDASLMESALEKIPVDAATSTDISGFVNRTSMFARRMLGKLAAGEQLTARQKEIAAYLYETNAALARELNALAVNTPGEELRDFFGGEAGGVQSRFAEWGKAAQERRKELFDAPFAGGGNVEENNVEQKSEVSVTDAEQKVRAFFEGYHIADVHMTGETAARDMNCYNFALTDENGAEIFAQVTKNGGEVAFFDVYESCTTKNFDLASCDAVAREFLSARGYTDLTATWFSDTGMVACITYVAETDGVRCYPAMVQVRVCEEKGRVVGMDARGYLLNRDNARRALQPSVSEADARAKLSAGLDVTASHLAIIPVHGRETLAYEFACNYGEEQYIVYIDARTGEEVQIFRVHESARGSYLR